jgi:hopene-associated glycosyltransferase HpnB
MYALGSLPVLIWLGILFHPARPWDFQPVGEDETPPGPDPEQWPDVAILVPARNEADSLPGALPSLLSQDYPGKYQIILVDDRSTDGTGKIAWSLAEQSGHTDRLQVIQGKPLETGWVGKVWAQHQAFSYLKEKNPNPPKYLLLTDADIRHEPGSLQRLVRESEGWKLALNSRMAHLRCETFYEKLLIPAFVFFFNLLYPMRRVNDPQSKQFGAAGGCVLLEREALERAGGFACIKKEIIDDVNLSKHIKALGVPIRLSLSRGEVRSMREYNDLGEVWKMVRRTAFTELKFSYVRLAGALLGLTLMFVVPVLWVFLGFGLGLAGSLGTLEISPLIAGGLAAKGFLVLAIMASVYRPASSFFKLGDGWSWSLPFAGVIYGMMTFDSAWRHTLGKGVQWREKKSV